MMPFTFTMIHVKLLVKTELSFQIEFPHICKQVFKYIHDIMSLDKLRLFNNYNINHYNTKYLRYGSNVC